MIYHLHNVVFFLNQAYRKCYLSKTLQVFRFDSKSADFETEALCGPNFSFPKFERWHPNKYFAILDYWVTLLAFFFVLEVLLQLICFFTESHPNI